MGVGLYGFAEAATLKLRAGPCWLCAWRVTAVGLISLSAAAQTCDQQASSLHTWAGPTACAIMCSRGQGRVESLVCSSAA